MKPHQREKMSQEIVLHKALAHKYVVQLFTYFEDSNFVYVVLELCRRRSLMELHKRRKAVTEPEARYFMNQILLGCKYIHETKIIHRDLKLGNIFLNDNMEVRKSSEGSRLLALLHLSFEMLIFVLRLQAGKNHAQARPEIPNAFV